MLCSPTYGIVLIVLSAVGKLSYHNTSNLTFENAKESCQREGKHIFTDLGFLLKNDKDIQSFMNDNHMSVAWIGKNMMSYNAGR